MSWLSCFFACDDVVSMYRESAGAFCWCEAKFLQSSYKVHMQHERLALGKSEAYNGFMT